MKIYAVDDTHEFRRMYEMLLDAKTFHGPDILIPYMKLERPDILICDLVLDGTSGWNVVREVRELFPNMPIIIATSCDEEIQKQFAKHRNLGYWFKSQDLEKLRNLVEEMSCTKPIEK